MVRAVGLQLAWRVLGCHSITVPFVDDSELMLRPTTSVAAGNFYAGLYEFVDMSFVLHMLREGDLFVDIGANVGTYTVLASAVRRCRTVAFEPISQTRARLVENLRLNHIEDRVSLRPMALGRARGFVELANDMDGANRVLDAGEQYAGTRETVEVSTLDEALAGEVPTVLKMDVEGYEGEVLAGATRTLQSPGLLAVIAEFHPGHSRYGGSDDTLLSLFAKNGFQSYTYIPLTRTLEVSTGTAASNNLILIRDLPEVLRRLTTASRFRVLGHEV